MNPQPPKEAPQCEYAGILGDSEDSEDEDPSPEDQLAVSWEDRSILERLGLSSVVDMTEEEVETSFTQLALGFHCDQYTLSQRLRVEEHDRLVAQENLSTELQRSRDTLQSLRGRCVDGERLDALSRIEARLDAVLASMDDIVHAAETLGAVHQEARVSRSVGLMEIHVGHLKRRHAAESAELLETRKLLHRRRGRLHSDSAVDGDIRHMLFRQGSQQLLRRRVSVTLIPTQAQTSDLEAQFHDGCRTDSQGPEGGAVTQATRQAEVWSFSRQSSTQSQEEENSPLQAALRHRWRSAVLEREFSTEVTGSGPGSEVTGSAPGSEVTGSAPGSVAGSGVAKASELTMADSGYATEPSVIPSEKRPLASWLSVLRRILLVLVVFLLCFLLVLVSLRWRLPPPHWTGNQC